MSTAESTSSATDAATTAAETVADSTADGSGTAAETDGIKLDVGSPVVVLTDEPDKSPEDPIPSGFGSGNAESSGPQLERPC